MDRVFTVRIEGAADCLAHMERSLGTSGTAYRRSNVKSISAIGGEALIVDLAKAAVPVVSAAIGAAVTAFVGRSVKLNGIEIRGYSTADIVKLMDRLSSMPKPSGTTDAHREP